MQIIVKLRHLFLKVFGSWIPRKWQPDILLPAVCVLVVNRDGKVLAVSRKNDPTAFGLPGGKVDLNWYGRPIETYEEAIRRETREETGLELGDLCILYVGTAEQEFWTVCYVSVVRGQIHTTEAGRVAWVGWDAILNGPFGVYNWRVKEMYDSLKSEKTK
jgi:ADP-ribose pyrophosphatase YjhB (NUDIX family)